MKSRHPQGLSALLVAAGEVVGFQKLRAASSSDYAVQLAELLAAAAAAQLGTAR